MIAEKNVNCVPICAQIPADLLTPVMAFLKITEKSEYSFLLESIMDGEHVARYSFIGSGEYNDFTHLDNEMISQTLNLTDPFKVIKTGEGYDIQGDPMKPLEAELAQYRYHSIPEVPTFTGESS